MKTIFLLTLTFLATYLPLTSQAQKKKFEVFHNDKKVGEMLMCKSDNGNISEIKMHITADLKLMLLKIHLDGREEAIFENEAMNYSYVLRKTNGKIRTNKQTKKAGKYYMAYDGEVGKMMEIKEIKHNLLSIIFSQPVNGQNVFVDHLQEAHQVRQMSPNVYRVMLRDGNFNQYTYQNGECATIEVNSSLLTLVMKKV